MEASDTSRVACPANLFWWLAEKARTKAGRHAPAHFENLCFYGKHAAHFEEEQTFRAQGVEYSAEETQMPVLFPPGVMEGLINYAVAQYNSPVVARMSEKERLRIIDATQFLVTFRGVTRVQNQDEDAGPVLRECCHATQRRRQQESQQST